MESSMATTAPVRPGEGTVPHPQQSQDVAFVLQGMSPGWEGVSVSAANSVLDLWQHGGKPEEDEREWVIKQQHRSRWC